MIGRHVVRYLKVCEQLLAACERVMHYHAFGTVPDAPPASVRLFIDGEEIVRNARK